MSDYAEFLATKKCAASSKPDYGLSVQEFDAEFGTCRGHHYIYGLHDPRTGELRYVGKSDKPLERLTQHLNEDRGTHRCNWVQSVKRAGLRPIMAIIDAGDPGTDWPTMERVYIAGARSSGAQLTNGTDGGEGVPGLPAETRKRMADARRGIPQSEETKAKRSAALKGRRQTQEWIQRMRELKAGKPPSQACVDAVRQRQEKLTSQQVRDIRRRVSGGERRKLLAVEYDVSIGTISNVCIGRTYGHVPDEETT